MRILVIPDIHLKPQIFDEVANLNTDLYDKIVCLGDLVDDFDKQQNYDLYEKTLQRVLEFDKEHPDMLWCWGNHDYSYRYALQESGFSYLMIPLINKYLIKLMEQCESRYKVIHRIDNVLFSHAGLTQEYVEYLYKRIPKDIDIILNKINDTIYQRSTIEDIWRDCSPIWTRPQNGLIEMYKEDYYFQVVGHTPVKQPLLVRNTLTLDTYSTYSNGDPYGNKALVVVDTKTHKWVTVN